MESDQDNTDIVETSNLDQTSEHSNEIEPKDSKVHNTSEMETEDSTKELHNETNKSDETKNILDKTSILSNEPDKLLNENKISNENKLSNEITVSNENNLQNENLENSQTDASNQANNAESNMETSEQENLSKSEPAANSEPSTNQQYDPKNVHYEGDLAIYTDPASGYQYSWNKDSQEWEPKSNTTYGFEDDTHTYTDADGVKFFWDKHKNAWFPKINDDFMARYQMNYGFVDNTQPTTNEKPEVKQPPPAIPDKMGKKGEKRKASEPTWFELDEKQNTKVYVSNLPLDITEEEFVELMQKYGIIMRDPITQKLKIKMYTEPNSDVLKGDALCTYIRIESVDLAIKLLNGFSLRGKEIKVERAKFHMKGAYDPKLKPKSKKKKEKLKLQRMQQKLFDWRPEKMRGERSKHEKIVILKNVFESSEFDKDVGLILEYQQDLREECSKCGEVRKVILFDRHPEGVAQVNMKDPEEADAVVKLLNGRWFGKRQLTAEIWDGKTKYKMQETDSQITQRLGNWDKFLEDEEAEASKNTEGSAKNLEKT